MRLTIVIKLKSEVMILLQSWCIACSKTLPSALSSAVIIFAAILLPIFSVQSAQAQLSEQPIEALHHIYIPRLDAATALNLLAKQTNKDLLFPYETARGITAKPVAGQYGLIDALALLLDGTGLKGELSANGMINIYVLPLQPPVKEVESVEKSLVESEEVVATEDDETEVITITGIRSSIVKSISNKRFSNDIVDTIDAEDMGKFPDVNIAESLQRIAGISIDRSGGEGQFITIRGLGPEFNSILFNGRNIATTTGSRAFSLDTITSEMNSAIYAYKSSNAQLNEGGLGGTIDIKTVRPFEQLGFRAVASFKGLYTDSSDQIEPQFSLLVSNTFFDDRLGILATINHQERSQRTSSVRNFKNNTDDLIIQKGPAWQDMPAEEVLANTLTNVVSPQSLDRDVMNEHRERTGGSLVVQYQMSDEALFTLDALYSAFDVKASGYSANNWFWYPTGAELDNNRTVTWLQHGASGFATAYRERARPTETSLLGVNLDWNITPNFSANVDGFFSKAVNENIGLNKDIIVEMISEEFVEYDFRSGGSYPSLYQPYITLPSTTNKGLLHPKRVESSGLDVNAENIGVKLDFTWLPEWSLIKSVRFGSHYNRNQKVNDNYEIAPEVTNLYATHSTLAQLFIPESLVSVGSLAGGWHGIADSVHEIDVDQYMSWLIDPLTVTALEQGTQGLSTGEAQAILAQNDFYQPHKTASSYQVNEEISALYLEGTLEHEIAQMPFSLVVGLRYSHTQLTSQGTQPKLVDIEELVDLPAGEQQSLLTLDYENDGQAFPVIGKNSYQAWLPSISGTLHISDEFILRSVFSKTLARPSLDDISPNLAMDNVSVDSRSASGGNTELSPYLSTNTDVSLEWYYDEASMLSIAAFGKKIKDWIVLSSQREVFELASPTYADFDVTRPSNLEHASIKGVELNWIHSFDSGFGFQANATFVDSNSDLSSVNSFAIEGLSDSANLVAFYEKDSIQIRLAYNIREQFLQHTFWNNSSEPAYVGNYKQLDVSASYSFNDHYSFYFEGINILNEPTRKYGREKSQFLEFSETGARYALGLRISF